MEMTPKAENAFTDPIADGYARILLKLDIIECEVENIAPDFVSEDNDETFLRVQPSVESGISIPSLETRYPLVFKRYLPDGSGVMLQLKEPWIWFDIEMDQVKDIWIDDLSFTIENKYGRYLIYYITKLDHKLEWLQPDLKTGEIKSMSVSTKKYKPPKIKGKELFTAQEVIRCADMIGRSVRKIDLRTGGAYVKFNTDRGRLEPLIIGMADKLGYNVEPLDKEVIEEMEAKGKRVSHAFYLKRT